MKHNKFLVVFIFLLLAVPLVVAQPQFVQDGDNSLDIEFSKITILQQNNNFTFQYHVFNSSDGILMTDSTTSCEFHLFENSGIHIVTTNSTTGGFILFTPEKDFEIFVDGGNFTRMGLYSVIMQCNTTTNFGGFISYEIIVTADGFPTRSFPIQFQLILFGFISIIFSFLFERLRMFKYMGSLIFLVMGVLTLYPGYGFLNWTTLTGKLLGFILIGSGFYFLIEDSFSRGEQTERFNQQDAGEDY